MADWALPFNISKYVFSGLLSISSGTSAHTKGAYTELVASTAYPISEIIFMDHGAMTYDADFLLDIAVGAAGAESIIIADLLVTLRPYATVFYSSLERYAFPVSVPPGTRISIRCQSTYAGANSHACAWGYGISGSIFSGVPPLSKVLTAGQVVADTGGTSVDPGASTGTKGAYSELSSAIPATISCFYVAIGNQGNTARTTASWNVDIAVGAAGAEVVIVADTLLRCRDTIDHVIPKLLGPFHIRIPAGTRVSIRADCSTADATDRLFDAIFYGVY